jgi:hypothetical protein
MGQDLIGIGQLAPAALARLTGGGSVALLVGVVEAIAIVFAMVAGVRDMRGHEEQNDGVDLTNLAMSAVLFLEWGFRTAAGHKWFTPMFLTAAAGVFVAFFRPWLATRTGRGKRSIRADDEGVHVRLSRWKQWRMRWDHLSSIDATGNTITFNLRDGSERILKLRRYSNADEIRSAVINQLTPLLRS